MEKKYILFILLFLLQIHSAQAQVVSFKDTIANYNYLRIKKNVTGAYVREGWGIANVIVGGAGLLAAKKDEWRYFHAMNAGFGALNILAGAAGTHRGYRDLHAKLTYEQAWQHYQADKKRYLINACFDIVCVGAGTVLNTYGQHTTDNSAIYSGFGKSLVVQGVFLLVLDNMLYAAQMRDNTRWYRIMDEIRISGQGIGFNYTF